MGAAYVSESGRVRSGECRMIPRIPIIGSLEIENAINNKPQCANKS